MLTRDVQPEDSGQHVDVVTPDMLAADDVLVISRYTSGSFGRVFAKRVVVREVNDAPVVRLINHSLSPQRPRELVTVVDNVYDNFSDGVNTRPFVRRFIADLHGL